MRFRPFKLATCSLLALSVSPVLAAEQSGSYDSGRIALQDPIPLQAVDWNADADLSNPTFPVTSLFDGVALTSANITSAPCACCNSHCCSKAKKEAATAAMKGAYKGVFYANDFSYLNDPCYSGPSFPGDSLKGLCCNRLDLGGELRFRYHHEENIRGLGLTGRDDEFWLTRVRLFSNWRINDYFRLYGEFLYADSGGQQFPARPIEVNRGEANNLFLDTKLLDELTARVGRQELLLGSQRLVSPLDWGNTRRTFDGARLIYSGDNWDVDGFWVNPVRRTDEYVDRWDATDSSIDFFGVYASRDGTSLGTVEAYYLGLDNQAANFDYHTLGSRVVGSTDGGLQYELEGGYQFGSNSPGYGNHDAGFVTAGLGRQFCIGTSGGAWKPTVWAYYDWASGGDDVPAARGDDSFDHLYPLAHKYNGLMDLFGRRNLHDANMIFSTPILGDKVSFLIWYHYFFLDEKTTPYSVVMTPYNPNNAAGDRELGHEIDVLFNINLNPRNNVLVGYSFFDAGAYYDTTAGIPNADPPRSNNDAQFFYFQYQTWF